MKKIFLTLIILLMVSCVQRNPEGYIENSYILKTCIDGVSYIIYRSSYIIVQVDRDNKPITCSVGNWNMDSNHLTVKEIIEKLSKLSPDTKILRYVSSEDDELQYVNKSDKYIVPVTFYDDKVQNKILIQDDIKSPHQYPENGVII